MWLSTHFVFIRTFRVVWEGILLDFDSNVIILIYSKTFLNQPEQAEHLQAKVEADSKVKSAEKRALPSAEKRTLPSSSLYFLHLFLPYS